MDREDGRKKGRNKWKSGLMEIMKLFCPLLRDDYKAYETVNPQLTAIFIFHSKSKDCYFSYGMLSWI